MKKRYSTLQKKLQELESSLNVVFSLPCEHPYHQLYTQDIEQRFLFLKNLLSAEIASSPKKPAHLEYIGKRLSELETAYHEWYELRTMTQDHAETVSTCSCTESCLNENEETSLELGSRGFEEPDNVLQGLIDKEKAPMEMETVSVDEKSDLKREEKGVVFRRFCGAVASGVVIGMALMGSVMVRLCGCSHSVEHGLCPTPT